MPIRKHFDFLFLHLIIYNHLRNPRDVHFMPMHSPWDCHWRTPSFGTVIPSCCDQRVHSRDRPLKNVAPARSNAGKLQRFFFRSFAGSETQWKMQGKQVLLWNGGFSNFPMDFLQFPMDLELIHSNPRGRRGRRSFGHS